MQQNASESRFSSLVKDTFKFKLYLLKNLPAAYFSGLKLKKLNEREAAVTVPFKWFTKNPFRSTYFASLSMAAEMSTGILAMQHLYKRTQPVSMLVISMEAKFHKKAVGITTFVCSDGIIIKDAIEDSFAVNEPKQVKAYSVGTNSSNEIVAEFWFTWSFKKKEKINS